jgi:iron complex outermembrane receptor protein
MKTLLSAVVVAMLALSAIEAAADATPGERQVALRIESADLATALDKWAQQSGFQIFYDRRITKNLIAPSVNGTYPAQAALEALLASTPLTYVWLNEKAVSIRKKAPPTMPAGLQRTGVDSPHGAIPKFGSDENGSASTVSAPLNAGLDAGHSARSETVEEILVTGTHIGGSVSLPSPVRSYDRQEVDRASGGNLAAFLKRLPQNFGGISEDTIGGIAGDAAATNETSGASVNLRGLGKDSTLVLINGRRIAPSGSDGSFVDISLIPVSAIDRVDVLTDGASAIYGSDAVGGVVNLILRSEFDRPETRLRYGAVSSGGSHEVQVNQTAGLNWSGGSALVAYDYDDRTSLDARDRPPPITGPFEDRYWLIPEMRRHGGLLTARHQVSPDLVLFSDNTWAKRSHEQQTEFFGQAQTDEAEVTSWSTNLGARKQYSPDFSLELSSGYSEGRQDFAQTLQPPVALQVIGRHTETSILSVDLSASGTLFPSSTLPTRYAVGTQYRQEEFDRKDTLNDVTGFANDRDVVAGFVELRIPLIAPAVSRGHGNVLELLIADRFENYSDFGSSNNPKLGAIWKPIDPVTLRGTWGTSFKAPLLDNLNPNLQQIVALGLPDPQASCGCGVTDTIFIFGGNPDLKAEKATTWTAGLDFVSSANSGIAAGATYYDIKYEDRIVGPVEAVEFFNALLSEAQLGSTVIGRDPAASTVQALTGNPIFQDFRDVTGSSGLGVAAIADYRLHNLAVVHTNGVDASVSYKSPTQWGHWEAGIEGTYILTFDRQFSPTAGIVEGVNAPYSPVDLRLRGRMAWAFANSSVSVYVNYSDSYSDKRDPALPRSVDSWTTIDMAASYDFDASNKVLSGVELNLTISNLTDEDPPFVAGAIVPINYDGTNANVLGRQISLQLSKRW